MGLPSSKLGTFFFYYYFSPHLYCPACTWDWWGGGGEKNIQRQPPVPQNKET